MAKLVLLLVSHCCCNLSPTLNTICLTFTCSIEWCWALWCAGRKEGDCMCLQCVVIMATQWQEYTDVMYLLDTAHGLCMLYVTACVSCSCRPALKLPVSGLCTCMCCKSSAMHSNRCVLSCYTVLLCTDLYYAVLCCTNVYYVLFIASLNPKMHTFVPWLIVHTAVATPLTVRMDPV